MSDYFPETKSTKAERIQLTVRVDSDTYKFIKQMADKPELNKLSNNQLIIEVLETFIFDSQLRNHISVPEDSKFKRQTKLRYYYPLNE